MAYAIVHHFPGATKEQYEASVKAIHGNLETLPEGQTFHVAGPVDGGWTVMAVHESKESWDTFNTTKLMPTLQAGVEGGFTTPPQETAFEVAYQLS